MRTGTKSAAVPDINAAYMLYEQGQMDDARKIINAILEKNPNHLQARALRDRMDTQELQTFTQKTRNLQEAGDVSPLMLTGLFVAGIVFALIGTLLAIKPVQTAVNAGSLTKEVVTEGAIVAGRMQAPAHFGLIFPVVLYLLAGACFFAYRRYRAE